MNSATFVFYKEALKYVDNIICGDDDNLWNMEEHYITNYFEEMAEARPEAYDKAWYALTVDIKLGKDVDYEKIKYKIIETENIKSYFENKN
jgi:hypothetical protein